MSVGVQVKGWVPSYFAAKAGGATSKATRAVVKTLQVLMGNLIRRFESRAADPAHGVVS
jgi:hypothetical protein